MTLVTTIGIDPGLVTTGMVVMRIDTVTRNIFVEAFAFTGDDHCPELWGTLDTLRYDKRRMFVEKYRPRGNVFTTDHPMQDLEQRLRNYFPTAKFIDNTGSRQIVRQVLLDILGLVKFPTTHHRDLEAAATIMVYGMLKDDTLNRMLFEIVQDHIDGRPWPIQS